MVDDKGSHFKTLFPDIFADYQNPPLTRDVAMANKSWQIWQNTPFSWWHCQLNFALWCASSGCGVSFEDHLQAEKPFLASLYRFRVYHTTRRLLEELRVALPGNKSYSCYENSFDSRAYKRLCIELAVPPEQDSRQKVDHGCQGLGSWSTFMTPSGAYRHAQVAQGPLFHAKDIMRHNRDIPGAWTTFVLDKSEGFTQAGVERLNDSVRTYVWAILGTQAQTRSNILKTETGFDVQKQFLANIEDAIASPVDIPSSISRYQRTLQYASTPHGLRVWDWAVSVAERHGTPSGQYPGVQQRDPDSRIGRGYRTQP